eukprot:749910-Hanusia_phi.AAC.4
MALSPDESYVVAGEEGGGKQGRAEQCRAEQRKGGDVLIGMLLEVCAKLISRKGKFAESSSENNERQVSKMTDMGRHIAGSVRAVEFHPSLPLIAAASLDRFVRGHLSITTISSSPHHLLPPSLLPPSLFSAFPCLPSFSLTSSPACTLLSSRALTPAS